MNTSLVHIPVVCFSIPNNESSDKTDPSFCVNVPTWKCVAVGTTYERVIVLCDKHPVPKLTYKISKELTNHIEQHPEEALMSFMLVAHITTSSVVLNIPKLITKTLEKYDSTKVDLNTTFVIVVPVTIDKTESLNKLQPMSKDKSLIAKLNNLNAFSRLNTYKYTNGAWR